MTFMKKHWKDILFWVLFFLLQVIDYLIKERMIHFFLILCILITLITLGHQTLKRDLRQIYKNQKLNETGIEE